MTKDRYYNVNYKLNQEFKVNLWLVELSNEFDHRFKLRLYKNTKNGRDQITVFVQLTFTITTLKVRHRVYRETGVNTRIFRPILINIIFTHEWIWKYCELQPEMPMLTVLKTMKNYFRIIGVRLWIFLHNFSTH